MSRWQRPSLSTLGGLSAFGLLALLVLPLVSLGVTTSLADLRAGLQHPGFASALALSVRTTLLSLTCVVVSGTPLAYWLATSRSRAVPAVELIVDLPLVIPPAAVGMALLATFGRSGLLGPWLGALGLDVPFSELAVVMAQVAVSAPFYVQAGANAFRKVDVDMLTVARTLGASPAGAFARVALPVALPGLVVGASLAWARALGEFGATLLFAGNLPGRTQTLPLALFDALESDVRLAVVYALVLVATGAALLLALRAVPGLLRRGPRALPASLAEAP